MRRKMRMMKKKPAEKEYPSSSVYMALTGKENPLWADKIYNPDVAKQRMEKKPKSWIRERSMNKLK